MTIDRSESCSHLGELHRVESSSTGTVSTVDLAEATDLSDDHRLAQHSTELQSRNRDVRARNWSDEQMRCQVHHFVDVTDLAPPGDLPLLSASSHTSSEPRSLSLFAPGHREQCRAGVVVALGAVCLPRLPQLNVTHEGKCWGSGQWRSGLMGVPSPQTHSARYCFFGGRTHPTATLPSPVSSCAVPFPARNLVPPCVLA